METAYYSREDSDSLDHMNKDFCGREGYVWFIEQEETQLWLMESGELTSDPSKAMQFKARMIAIAEKVRRNLHKGWKATEHEFVAILSFASPKEETNKDWVKEQVDRFQKFLDSMPDEELDKMVKQVEESGISGPTVEEYFAALGGKKEETPASKGETQSNIKPCPFCGTQPEWYGEAISDGHYALRCPNCHCMIREDRRDKTIGIWNNRYETPASKENIHYNAEEFKKWLSTPDGMRYTKWFFSEDEDGKVMYEKAKEEMLNKYTPASKEKPDFEKMQKESSEPHFSKDFVEQKDRYITKLELKIAALQEEIRQLKNKQ
ncbi:MAG: hypothetical protein BWY15_02108 [Firmicutes bacterium ADurb.Bin193]|nr:MAG: hypothetical protein BWY15_02108 [Firmicutes bacterium ADurb.Bin193]